MGRTSREFVVRFAAGQESAAYSGVWRIWAGRKTPDLYLAIRSMSGVIKASVHGPRPHMPSWKRHFGFAHNATGNVADAVRADGATRHKAEWAGAGNGKGVTLEWRIFIPGPALSKAPHSVGSEVALIPPPKTNECLIVAVFLGPNVPTVGCPRFADAGTNLLAQGSLSDGRIVWVIYCYVPMESIRFPQPQNKQPKFYGSPYDVIKAGNNLRATLIAENSDGSLVFLDSRVDINIGKLKRFRIVARHILSRAYKRFWNLLN